MNEPLHEGFTNECSLAATFMNSLLYWDTLGSFDFHNKTDQTITIEIATINDPYVFHTVNYVGPNDRCTLQIYKNIGNIIHITTYYDGKQLVVGVGALSPGRIITITESHIVAAKAKAVRRGMQHPKEALILTDGPDTTGIEVAMAI